MLRSLLVLGRNGTLIHLPFRIWERMVSTVKNVMVVLNDGRRILLTTLAETEDMVNSRPLVYASQGAVQETLLTIFFEEWLQTNPIKFCLLPIQIVHFVIRTSVL